jgi:hypothetical protein
MFLVYAFLAIFNKIIAGEEGGWFWKFNTFSTYVKDPTGMTNNIRYK